MVFHRQNAKVYERMWNHRDSIFGRLKGLQMPFAIRGSKEQERSLYSSHLVL